MEEGRVYTHGTLRAARRRSEHAGTAKLRGCQVRTTFRRFGNVASGRFWHVQRAPACRYALWRRAPLLGPPPWPPMVPTSAARRPIALRREPTSRSLRSRTCRARSDGTRRRTSRTLSERQGATHESDGSTSRIRSLRGGVWCRALSGRHVEPRLKGWSLLSSSVGATSRLVATTLKLESVRVASRLDAPGTGSCLGKAALRLQGGAPF